MTPKWRLLHCLRKAKSTQHGHLLTLCSGFLLILWMIICRIASLMLNNGLTRMSTNRNSLASHSPIKAISNNRSQTSPTWTVRGVRRATRFGMPLSQAARMAATIALDRLNCPVTGSRLSSNHTLCHLEPRKRHLLCTAERLLTEDLPVKCHSSSSPLKL